MSDAYIGEIRIWSGTYIPEGWSRCDGKLLKVQEHEALFSLIGNNYGGDGLKEFAVPNLVGAVPVGARHQTDQKDTLPAGSSYIVGRGGGEKQVTYRLPAIPLPKHTHTATFTVTKEVPSTPPKIAVSSATAPTPTLVSQGNALAKGVKPPTDPVLGYAAAPSQNSYLAGVSKGGGGGITDGKVKILASKAIEAPPPPPVVFDLRKPYLALDFIICLSGEYPSSA